MYPMLAQIIYSRICCNWALSGVGWLVGGRLSIRNTEDTVEYDADGYLLIAITFR